MAQVPVDINSVRLAASLSCYWAWVNLTANMFPASLTDIAGGSVVVWLINVSVHAALMIFGAIISLRVDGSRHEAIRLSASGLLSCCGTILAEVSCMMESVALVYTASAMMGAAAAVQALVLFRRFAFCGMRKTLFTLISLAVAASPLISLVLLALPRPLYSILLPVLPLLASFFGKGGGKPGSPLFSRSRLSEAGRKLSVPLLACSFVFSFTASLFVAANSSSDARYLSNVMSVVFVAMIVIAALVAVREKRHMPTLLMLICMPILAGIALLAPFLFPTGGYIVDVLVRVAKNLFSIYLYSSLVFLIANNGHGTFLIGITIGVGDVGHMVGSTLKIILDTNSGQQIFMVCVVVSYLVLICALLVFYPSKLNRDLFFQNILGNKINKLDINQDIEYNPFDIAASEIGLSDREREVLCLLVESRTLTNIANELGISYNTVKTHASHIFHKANVSSREELALWLESFSERY